MEQLKKIGAADLALVDWDMPVVTGYELICEVRANKEFEKLLKLGLSVKPNIERIGGRVDLNSRAGVETVYGARARSSRASRYLQGLRS